MDPLTSTATQPLPVIVPDQPSAARHPTRRPIRPRTVVLSAVIAAVVLWGALNWSTVLSLLVAVLLGVLALFLLSVLLLRVVFGQGTSAGWALIGAALAALLLGRRR